MPNSNEKLVAGIAALIPIAIDAFKDDHLDRQVDAILTNTKVRDTGSRLAKQTESYFRDLLKGNKFTRQVAAQFRPSPSVAPAIVTGLAVVVVAGLVFAYFERRKKPKAAPESQAPTPEPAAT